jgi:anti-sigma regulatory factor (Ser/Thr protein kinase)
MKIPALIFSHRLEAPFHALEIRVAREDLLDQCLRVGLDEALAWDLAAIADELTSNVLEHSHATWMEWAVTWDIEEGLYFLRFQDNGSRFDPSTHPLAAVGDGSHGGMGLAMTRRLARGLRYRHEGLVNQLEVQMGPLARLALA